MRVTGRQAQALVTLQEHPDASLYELVDAAGLPVASAKVSQAFIWRLIDTGMLKVELTLGGRAAIEQAKRARGAEKW